METTPLWTIRCICRISNEKGQPRREAEAGDPVCGCPFHSLFSLRNSGQSDIDRNVLARNIASAGLIVLSYSTEKLQLRLLVDGIERHEISGHIVTEFLVVRSVRVAGAAVDQSCSQIELFNRREIDLSRCLETFMIGKTFPVSSSIGRLKSTIPLAPHWSLKRWSSVASKPVMWARSTFTGNQRCVCFVFSPADAPALVRHRRKPYPDWWRALIRHPNRVHKNPISRLNQDFPTAG